MTKKQRIIELIRIASYQGDDRGAVRLYVENRISYADYSEAVRKGREQRKAANQ